MKSSPCQKHLIFGFFVSLLTACGGGGSSSSSSAPSTPNTSAPPPDPSILFYSGSRNKAALNEANFQSYVKFFLGSSFNSAFNSVDGDSSVDGDKLIGRCGGNASFKDLRASGSQLGNIEFNFSNFNDCSGTVITGAMVIDVKQYDASRQELLKADLTLTQVKFSSDSSQLLMSGVVTNERRDNDREELFSTSVFDVKELTSGLEYRFENYQERSYYSDTFTEEVNAVSYQGRIYKSDEGFIELTTTADFVCVTNNREDCLKDKQKSGEVFLSGSEGSIVAVDFIEHNKSGYKSMVSVDLDANADGFYEVAAVLPFDAKSVRSDTDYPFTYAGRNAVVKFPEHSQFKLAGVGYSPSSDNLSYEYFGPSRLNCGFEQPVAKNIETQQASLSDKSSKSPTLNVQAYGDYSVTLRVTNQDTGRFSSDCIGLRFYESQFISSQFSDVEIDSPRYGGRGAHKLAAFDINNDKKLELLVQEGNEPRLQYYTQDTDGLFKFHSLSNIESRPTYAVQDLNADGKLQLVSVNSEGGNLYSLNVGTINSDLTVSSRIKLIEFEVSSRKKVIRLSDLDKDGLTDIIFMDTTSMQVFKQSAGGFNSAGELTLTSEALQSHFFSPHLADLDGDGVKTPVSLFKDVNSISVIQYHLEDGKLRELSQTELRSCSGCSSSDFAFRGFWAGNIDSSREDELFISWFRDNETSIHKLDNTKAIQVSSFKASYESFANVFEHPSFIFADFNKDGLIDILASDSNHLRSGGARSSVLLQTDGVVFEEEIRVPFQSSYTTYLDLDGDGSKELLDFSRDKIIVGKLQFE